MSKGKCLILAVKQDREKITLSFKSTVGLSH
jgi:hypothetical protein